MTDILTITLNPALDLSCAAPSISPGPKLRCTAPVAEPGGGGINVARAVSHLDGKARALVALGGATGAQLGDLLNAGGIETVAFNAPGDTRQSLAVTDQSTGGQYRFVMPGPVWAQSDIDRLINAVAAQTRPGGLVVISGSMPPGCPAGLIADLSRKTRDAGGRAILDTSGEALRMAATQTDRAAFILRMDSGEAEELAGRPLPDRLDSAGLARDLVTSGAAEAVVIARGADGSVMACADGRWHTMAADVPVVSKVGAGDSFVGGMSLALARGDTLPDALQFGAAAASSAVMTPGTELCRREDAERLRPLCHLTQLEGAT
ncbi:1-phosphofructokinase family hexose kinase [Pseudoprimorskyibacter insulae]|uniref:Phosphofructokinase n=1 Tax=Pseudoprimorskyibacter insulae TaxID=1695997 RepID=A0A2R8APG3_9RHOB|nr:1-phosphofructokinase family hexose kinase [Pseudoprimorskyibacter insulae]SPF77958.1 ATP-dependent 6-phosphofructokinase isozyme 2 [Pseudoprimorskyibacter insulae]